MRSKWKHEDRRKKSNREVRPLRMEDLLRTELDPLVGILGNNIEKGSFRLFSPSWTTTFTDSESRYSSGWATLTRWPFQIRNGGTKSWCIYFAGRIFSANWYINAENIFRVFVFLVQTRNERQKSCRFRVKIVVVKFLLSMKNPMKIFPKFLI